MDELTSIGIWFFVIIISINAGIIYMSTQTPMASEGLMPGITANTYFSSYNYTIADSNVGGNTISSTEPTISNTWLGDMITTAAKVGNTFRILLTAWTDLLSAIFVNVPGGAFFANIILPIIGIVQIVAFFILGVRVAGVIRGVV